MTKAEKDAREWLRLNAWEDEDRIRRMPPSMTQHGILHVQALLDVIVDLKNDLHIERKRVERMLDEGHRLRQP